MIVRESLLVIIGLCNKILSEFNVGKSISDKPANDEIKTSFARLASQLRMLREMMGGLSLQDNLTPQSFSSFVRAIRREFLECPA